MPPSQNTRGVVHSERQSTVACEGVTRLEKDRWLANAGHETTCWTGFESSGHLNSSGHKSWGRPRLATV